MKRGRLSLVTVVLGFGIILGGIGFWWSGSAGDTPEDNTRPLAAIGGRSTPSTAERMSPSNAKMRRALAARPWLNSAARAGGASQDRGIQDRGIQDRGIQDRDTTGAAGSADNAGGVEVDIAAVEAALARLNEVGERITQEQLDEEQEQMHAALERFSTIEAPKPTAREIIDDNGRRWIELTYASGHVRYEFPQ